MTSLDFLPLLHAPWKLARSRQKPVLCLLPICPCFTCTSCFFLFACIIGIYETTSPGKGAIEPVTDDWRRLPVSTLYQCRTSIQGKSQAPSRDRKRKQTFPVTINKLAPVLVTLKCVLLRYFCH